MNSTTSMTTPKITKEEAISVPANQNLEVDDNDENIELNTDNYDFTVGANNYNMNMHTSKMVTDGEYLYACIPSELGIFKCLVSKCKSMHNTSNNIADGGVEVIEDLRNSLG